jgi:glycosyltransferase involved in cell wall biosynthesis
MFLLGKRIKMNIVILAKNPYNYPEKKITPYLAGHSIGFVAPLIEYLLKKNNNNNKVVLISPPYYRKGELTTSKGFYEPPKNNDFTQIFIKGIKLPKVPFNYGDLMIQSAITDAKKIMQGIDLVLVVYVFPWIVATNYLKEDLGFKTISFLRGSDVFSGCYKNSPYREKFSNQSWDSVVEIITRSINKSEKIFAVSNMLKRFANNNHIRVDNIFPTPVYPKSDLIKKIKDKQFLRKMFLIDKVIKKQFGKLDLKKKWISYLGRFSSEKQVSLVIEAFNNYKKNKDCCLILGGIGLERKNLENIKKKYKLKNVYIGFIPPKYVPLFSKCIDLFIHPTTPQSFLDARPSTCTNVSYMGIPIIFPYREGMECTGLSESVSELNTKFLSVDPTLNKKQIAEKIAEKIDLIFSNKKLYKKISKANSIFAEKFSADKIFNKLLREIKNV